MSQITSSSGSIGAAAFDLDVSPDAPATGNDPGAMFKDLPADQPKEKQEAKPVQEKSAPKKEAKANEEEIDTTIGDDVEEEIEADDDDEEIGEPEEGGIEEIEAADKKPEKKSKGVKVYDSQGKVVSELDPSTVVDVVIDGKKSRISLKELQSNYSGKVVFEKKFQEIDSQRKQNIKERQEWESKRDLLNNRVNDFYKLATSGRPVEALDYLIGMSGLNSKEFFKNLRGTMYKQALEYFQMPEHERAQMDKRYDMELEEAHLKRQREDFERVQREHGEKAKRAEIMSQYGMNDDIYTDIEKKFLEHGVDRKEITPELIARTHIRGLAYQKSADILKKVDPELVKNNDALQFVFDTMIENNELNDEDLVEIVRQATSTKRSKNINKKLKKTSNPPVVTKSAPKQEKEHKLSKDDLMF